MEHNATEIESIKFAKQNKVEISRRLTDPSVYPPSSAPVSVFMAGSPGAGKTEFSKRLLELIVRDTNDRPLRIDGDEIRKEIPGYTGSNSSEVQGAVSILVREIYERTLKNKQSVIFDGTFSKYEKALENVTRSLKRNRLVVIFYVYQDPLVAWQFTVAREKVEGRNIPRTAFIEHFIGAKETVGRIRDEFDDSVQIYLVRKNHQTNQVESVDEIAAKGPALDSYLGDEYTKEQIENMI